MLGYFSPHAYRYMYALPSLKLPLALVFAPLEKLIVCADFLCL